VSATRSGRCAYCGQSFTVARRPGPAPRYCSQAHRQRAYEIRRSSGRRSREDTLAEEVTRLRTQVRRLEYDNRRLREELTETSAEAGRLYRELHPAPPSLATIAGQPNPAAAEPSQVPARKRRWTRTTGT
jgi:hypothetical protein